MSTPFVVFSLPRSRSTWISRFLSYRDWHCGHDQIRYFRGLDDVRSWLAQGCVGTAETNAASWWRLLQKYRPDARIVVIRRSVEDVAASLSVVRGYDEAEATKDHLKRLDAKLDQIEHRLENVVSVRFEDLANEQTCRRVFEHCLPYKHDRAWWQMWAARNVQCQVPALIHYVEAHRAQLDKIAAQTKHVMLADLARRPLVDVGGIVLRRESFDDFYRDGQKLFADHLVQVDEAPEAFTKKNIDLMTTLGRMGVLQVVTARANGKMFGYLMTILSPSLERENLMTAVHTTFFASKDVPGLGLRLQRFAVEELRKRGVGELYFRAGPRGDGPKMGALYRRLGAAPAGELYQLQVEG